MKRSLIRKVVLGAMVAGATLTLAAPASRAAPEGEVAVAETCTHYANRARFMPRRGRVDFVVILAEGCLAAHRSLTARDPQERRAAQDFLVTLVRLRATIIGMNMDKLTRPRPGAGQRGRVRRLGAVSRSGEFLIAHRMGLIRDLERWRRHAPGFSIALR